MEQQEMTPAQAYQEYFGPAMFDPLADLVVELAELRAGQRVLDVACGTGIAARRAATAVGSRGAVTGVDVNPAMIDVARAHPSPGAAPIDWREGDAVALDLPDDAFDAVLCQQGLQFVSDRGAAVREMRRVLVDTGRLAIAVWRGLDHHPLFRALAEAEEPHLHRLGVEATWNELIAPFTLGDADQLRSLLDGAGFGHVDVVPRTIEARFATPDRFVERMEFAYAAVVPQFAEDPSAFAAYLDAVNRATKDVVCRHRRGDHIVVPMHTHIATARL